MSREKLVSRVIVLPMVLSGYCVSLKIAEIKAGNKQANTPSPPPPK